jgi:hypothetical protein
MTCSHINVPMGLLGDDSSKDENLEAAVTSHP